MRLAIALAFLLSLSGCARDSATTATTPATPPPPKAEPAAVSPADPVAPVIRKIETEELKFKQGESSVTVQDVLVRGDTHWIEFVANAGQVLDVSIASAEDNAIFRLYLVSPYGWQDRLNDEENVAFRDIETDPEGTVSESDDERVSWKGKLPYGSKTGKLSIYAIEVGATRGNASYALTVSIT